MKILEDPCLSQSVSVREIKSYQQQLIKSKRRKTSKEQKSRAERIRVNQRNLEKTVEIKKGACGVGDSETESITLECFYPDYSVHTGNPAACRRFSDSKRDPNSVGRNNDPISDNLLIWEDALLQQETGDSQKEVNQIGTRDKSDKASHENSQALSKKLAFAFLEDDSKIRERGRIFYLVCVLLSLPLVFALQKWGYDTSLLDHKKSTEDEREFIQGEPGKTHQTKPRQATPPGKSKIQEWIKKAEIMIQKRQLAKLLRKLEFWLTLAPRKPKLRFFYSIALSLQRPPQLLKAIAQLEKSVNLDRRFSRAYYHLYLLYQKVGQRDLALIAIDNYFRLRSRDKQIASQLSM